MIKHKFKIDGMHCTSCGFNIDMDLEELEGVKRAHTSYTKGETEVEFDPDKVSVEKIMETIKKTGYNTQASS